VLVKPIRGRLDIFNVPWIDYDILPKRQPNND
jgi:hypothetical protein